MCLVASLNIQTKDWMDRHEGYKIVSTQGIWMKIVSPTEFVEEIKEDNKNE